MNGPSEMYDPPMPDDVLISVWNSHYQELLALVADVPRLQEIERRAKVVDMYGTDAVRPSAHWILHGPSVADPEEGR